MKTTLPKTSGYLPGMFNQAATHFATRANRELTLAVACPTCRCRFHVVDASHENEMIRCDKCTTEFRLSAGQNWVDYLEFKLPLTVLGLWVFIFQRIPAWAMSQVSALLATIEAFLNWVFPMGWRCLKVFGWAMIGVFIPVVPAAILGVMASGANRLPPPFQWIGLGLGLLAVGWFLLVAGGYTWAWAHHRRGRKQSLRQLPPLAMPASPNAG